MASDDVYRPHTFEYVAAMVTPEVSARLDRSRLYGIWWFNRRARKERQVAEVGENGRRCRRRSKNTMKAAGGVGGGARAGPRRSEGVGGRCPRGDKGQLQAPFSNRRF